jgi:NH3-dependent NAD+ synthetase
MHFIKQKLEMLKYFARGVFIGWSGVYVDITSYRVLSVARVHKTKQTQNTIGVAHYYTQTNTNNVNKTWTLLEINTNNGNKTWALLQITGD